jgi:carboxymethylenebutenolidase
MTCENVTIKGDKGTPITAYVAKPSGPGPFPGVVLVHHLPGWSEFYNETTRRFAHYGYLTICSNLYERAGQGNPDDVAAKVRADGGIVGRQRGRVPSKIHGGWQAHGRRRACRCMHPR